MVSKYATAILALGLACSPAARAQQPHAPHWDYAGPAGPDAWGTLDVAYARCGIGQAQSPVDIRTTKEAALPPLAPVYRSSHADVVDTGHTIQVDLTDAGALTLDGTPYTLVQFHFHTPSEETVAGQAYPMVAHLVHRSAEGRLAVIGVLLREGRAHPALDAVFDNLPVRAGAHTTLPAAFDVSALLPAERGYWRYTGSLTTPPCSEGVRWHVLKTPVEVSKAQIDALRARYPANARPVQPLNGRVIEES